jgi:hypothetical protein
MLITSYRLSIDAAMQIRHKVRAFGASVELSIESGHVMCSDERTPHQVHP